MDKTESKSSETSQKSEVELMREELENQKKANSALLASLEAMSAQGAPQGLPTQTDAPAGDTPPKKGVKMVSEEEMAKIIEGDPEALSTVIARAIAAADPIITEKVTRSLGQHVGITAAQTASRQVSFDNYLGKNPELESIPAYFAQVVNRVSAKPENKGKPFSAILAEAHTELKPLLGSTQSSKGEDVKPAPKAQGSPPSGSQPKATNQNMSPNASLFKTPIGK